ncbi:hypothetical protein HGRIS_001758 [Hohenbuehelia grisea]|uniref:Pinin/SDK/MemA protein domain-containing protein n=1 Tax=Hohenbuehelia grisea TaxID=104357 RepID=A0ABR3JID7_9AGAR
MSSEHPSQDAIRPDSEELPPQTPTEPTAATRKRPRLVMGAEGERERKRGKTMFGLLLGTLNKAKIEDKERNASEAAKKRQLIEQRLQAKLRKETDSVRRAEEAKKDKSAASRKEEDLQLKDSIYKLRRKRLPLLTNFLCTSDRIPDDDSMLPSPTDPLAPIPRSHPPPIYYLPAVLTPAQESFLSRRKEEVTEAAEKEWEAFKEERTAGISEIQQIRQRVAEELDRKKAEKEKDALETEATVEGAVENQDKSSNGEPKNAAAPTAVSAQEASSGDAEMDVDEARSQKDDSKAADLVQKEEPAVMPADDDDAVEY